ncbi:MAG: folate-binding protein [Burkholderiales bacterium]|nr:folate-binding protein [Burkholderiales bacterium]
MAIARLDSYGVLRVSGADARSFLHAQLTVDVAHLAPDVARRAGWCAANGRLLATLLVVPFGEGFLLQLARDLAATVAARLARFVLRAKVVIADQSEACAQHGLWGDGALRELVGRGLTPPSVDLGVSVSGERVTVRLGPERYLVLGDPAFEADTDEAQWRLEDIRAGIPSITSATQDRFVPQMVNLERIGAVDFRKGCYPGQEVVARAQYRGAVKRRMYRLATGGPLEPGQGLYCDSQPGEPVGTVVNAADGEALAVLPSTAVESGETIRTAPGGEPLALLALPYA